MIIPDDLDASSPLKGDDNRAQQPISSALLESSSPPPPPYQATSPYVSAADFAEIEEPARRRFVRAFLIAISIWAVAGILISSAVELRRSAPWGNIDIPEIDDEDGNIDRCVPWTSATSPEHPRLPTLASGTWSRAIINLSADADDLYFIARGARASGTLYVSESHTTKDVSVTVYANHDGTESFPSASVCRLSQNDEKLGVGIFHTPQRWRIPWPGDRRNPRFVVEVGLPSGHGTVRYVPSFRADVPMFALAIGDLMGFRFGHFALTSSDSPVSVEGVFADSLKVHTTNGAIRGTFNTSDSLTLNTTNLPISVRIGAENGGSGKPTDVLMQTDNILIEADISLTSKSSSGMGGTFGVHAHTTNGHIKIGYECAPVDSVLNFDARSTNAPVHVVLSPTYEGTFSLKTTNSRAVLDQPRNVEDPSGRGRKRLLSSHSPNKQVVYGELKWLPSRRDGHAGSVDIATTNDFVQLST